MIKSMTGFGSAEGEVGGAHVSVEIRSVNHRFFNPSVKLPSELTARSPKTAGQVQVQVGAADARYHGIHCRGQAECEPGGGAFWWRDGSRLDPHRRH